MHRWCLIDGSLDLAYLKYQSPCEARSALVKHVVVAKLVTPCQYSSPCTSMWRLCSTTCIRQAVAGNRVALVLLLRDCETLAEVAAAPCRKLPCSISEAALVTIAPKWLAPLAVIPTSTN